MNTNEKEKGKKKNKDFNICYVTIALILQSTICCPPATTHREVEYIERSGQGRDKASPKTKRGPPLLTPPIQKKKKKKKKEWWLPFNYHSYYFQHQNSCKCIPTTKTIRQRSLGQNNIKLKPNRRKRFSLPELLLNLMRLNGISCLLFVINPDFES